MYFTIYSVISDYLEVLFLQMFAPHSRAMVGLRWQGRRGPFSRQSAEKYKTNRERKKVRRGKKEERKKRKYTHEQARIYRGGGTAIPCPPFFGASLQKKNTQNKKIDDRRSFTNSQFFLLIIYN